MISSKQSVASIVTAHPECAAVFQQLRIDFCSKAEQSLELACATRKLSLPEVVDELTCAIDEADDTGGASLAKMSTMALIAHIVAKHHEYLRKTLPVVLALAAKSVEDDVERDAHLAAVSEIVSALSVVLFPHLDREEKELFPLLLSSAPAPAEVNAAFSRVKDEHQVVVSLLGRLRDAREAFNRSVPSPSSSPSLSPELERLELDLLLHVHLENHVLFPRFE